ncbi:hypothetical protein HAX54_021351 [Datura stramonium]|uniref:Uncharacterized protein n=1 Tax=Datura stramonium TaxID=4076 RepID=A0ABS8S3W0_DATST|nr:hypothetical protein [Datura stramonium]
MVTYTKPAGIRIGSPSKGNRPTPQFATLSNHQEADKSNANGGDLIELLLVGIKSFSVKEALKGDVTAGVGIELLSRIRLIRILFQLYLVKTLFKLLQGISITTITGIDKSYKLGMETVNTSSKELPVSSIQVNSSGQDKLAQHTGNEKE